MHVQSCIVYKWMAVLILVIKDIKVEQLNVFTGNILFEEFFSVEHCNEFSISFKKREKLAYMHYSHTSFKETKIFS